MTYNTQNEIVLKHLIDNPITPKEAIERYGVYRLSARIKNLRDKGHIIETKAMRFKNAAGHTVSFAKYELIRLKEQVYATAQ